MRLSRIEIENFKGIGSRQLIDLRPITLLFGPNSAGKSTILQALHYVREILERRNLDPDQTIAGGLIDLGGFATLVHGHDLNSAIFLKVRIDMIDDHGCEELPLNSGEDFENPKFANLPIRYLLGVDAERHEPAIVREVGVGLEVRWSALAQTPYISRVEIEMDGEPIAELRSPPQQGRTELAAFNFLHPLLCPVYDDGSRSEPPDEDLEEFEEHEFMVSLVDPLSTPLGGELSELRREQPTEVGTKSALDVRIPVETPFGALPDLDGVLRVDLSDIDTNLYKQRYFPGGSRRLMYVAGESMAADEYEIEARRRAGVTELLSELVLGPLRIVRRHLERLTYIGPLREIPNRGYRPQRSPGESRWASGLAAWDLLYTDYSGKLLTEVNEWLSGDDKLHTRYEVDRTQYKEIEVGSRLHQLFDRGLSEEDLAELQELYSSVNTRTEISLRDVTSRLVVSPGDVGVGISQMVPVVVGCLRGGEGILAIEQPELHLHPGVQVGLGDLFIRAIRSREDEIGSGKTLLIETHSEHLMLRLLRRIRQTGEDELPPLAPRLTPEQLAVIYVEGADEGVLFRSLRVRGDGEFLDEWPKGFFEERAEEIF
jgi:hypothetical protein